MLRSPKLQNLLVDNLVVPQRDIFQNRTLCEAEQRRIYKCILLHFSSYVRHTLYTVLQGTFFSPFHQQQFFPACVFWNHQRVCLLDSVLVPVCFSGIWRSSEFDLAVIWTSNIHAGSSCTLLFCLWVSCTHKMHWRVHSLADTVPHFWTILHFSSELSNNWGTGLPCLRLLWIYCTGQ